jgi:ligand-binding sensor domain-containing protein
MAYTINLTNGTILTTIADGTINNTVCSQTLIGKNYAGYGQFLDDNFVHLLESGANSTPPGAPLTGQLWWDTSSGLLKVYNGTTFKTVSSTTAQSSAPTSNVTGDLWYDTTNQQLKVYTGTTWLVVGPAYTSGTGVTGAIATTIVDNTSTSHVVIELYVNDSIVGIISKDATFTPQVALTGFTTVRPGITLSTLVGSQVHKA